MLGLDSEKNIVAVPAQPPKQCNSKQTLLVAKLSSSSHLLTVNSKASQRPTQGCTGQRVLPLWTHLSCSFTCLAPASQACLLAVPTPGPLHLCSLPGVSSLRHPQGPLRHQMWPVLCHFLVLFLCSWHKETLHAKTLHDLRIDPVYSLSPLACKLREGRVFVQPVQLCPPQRRL